MAEYEEEWYTGIDGISATRGSCDIVLEKEGDMVVYSLAKLGSFGRLVPSRFRISRTSLMRKRLVYLDRETRPPS